MSKARTPRATPRPIARVLLWLDAVLAAIGEDVVVGVNVDDGCDWEEDVDDDDVEGVNEVVGIVEVERVDEVVVVACN